MEIIEHIYTHIFVHTYTCAPHFSKFFEVFHNNYWKFILYLILHIMLGEQNVNDIEILLKIKNY